jgi:hypothetical protein
MQGGIYPHREHESNQMVLEGHEAPVAEASLALFLFLPWQTTCLAKLAM